MDHRMSVTEILDALYDGCAAEWAEGFLEEVEAWAADLRASIEEGADGEEE